MRKDIESLIAESIVEGFGVISNGLVFGCGWHVVLTIIGGF